MQAEDSSEQLCRRRLSSLQCVLLDAGLEKSHSWFGLGMPLANG